MAYRLNKSTLSTKKKIPLRLRKISRQILVDYRFNTFVFNWNHVRLFVRKINNFKTLF